MKVLFTVLGELCFPHLEIALDLMQRHLDDNNEVFCLICDADIPICRGNWDNSIKKCLYCEWVTFEGIWALDRRLVVNSYKNFIDRTLRTELRKISDKEFSNIKELKSFSVTSFDDIGWGVASCLITELRNPNPDTKKHGKEIKDSIFASLIVFHSVNAFLKQNSIDACYIFNGRYALPRAAWSACKNNKVPVYFHERGHDKTSVGVFKNSLPQDLKYIQQLIFNRWESEQDLIKRRQIGETFFKERLNRIEQSWYSFTTKQKHELLPESWNPANHNIAIFNSSEDEFISINKDWDTSLYGEQITGLKAIIESLKDKKSLYPSLKLYIRIHPNLQKASPTLIDELMRLGNEFVEVIPPESPIDSYALLMHCNKVLTFGSTMGIEATFWGKPSILAGNAFYSEVGGTYNPVSHDEVIQFLLDYDLQAKPKENAIMYGHYARSFGIPLKYTKLDGLFSATFKGKRLGSKNFIVAPLKYTGFLAGMIIRHRDFTKLYVSIVLVLSKRIGRLISEKARVG
jgi:hypothetical protein